MDSSGRPKINLSDCRSYPGVLLDMQSKIKWGRQTGASHGWMLLTIGIMVGFVLGFVLFLSRLPEEQYTLVETERTVESYETADPSQFGFYDNLPGVRDAVPNVAADQMPAFSRSERTGRYGAAADQRPSAVQVAEELNSTGGVQPLEVAAVGTSTLSPVVTNALARQQSDQMRTIQQSSIVKKIPNTPTTFYYLQAGAFINNGDANRMKNKLVQSGMDAFIRTIPKDGKQLHRVRIGPFYDAKSLRDAQSRLAQSGMGYLVIKVQS